MVVPESQQLPFQFSPWAQRERAGTRWWTQNETRIVGSAACLVILLIGWQLGSWWKTSSALDFYEHRLEQQRVESAPELEAREQALDLIARAETLLAFLPQRNSLELLMQISEALPNNSRLVRWEQKPGSIAMAIQSDPAPNTESVVRSLEDVGGLTQIVAERGRQAGVLEVSAVLAGAPG